MGRGASADVFGTVQEGYLLTYLREDEGLFTARGAGNLCFTQIGRALPGVHSGGGAEGNEPKVPGSYGTTGRKP